MKAHEESQRDDEEQALTGHNGWARDLFYLALLAVILGFQLFLAGFICEMISRNSQDRNHYNIKEEI